MKLSFLLLFMIYCIDYDTTQAADTNQTCTDVLPNCSKFKDSVCKNTKYKYLMADKCASTCDLCCKDKQKGCPHWSKNGYCNSAKYTDEQKLEACALTCDLCNKNVTVTTNTNSTNTNSTSTNTTRI